ncbi:MAG: ribonuclease E/G [Bradymonadia bacterium]
MTKRMLVNAAQAGEVRVAIVQDSTLEDLNVATENNTQIQGNIYRAKVVSVESGLQAAFVDYGAERNGFITFNDIHERYYSRPAKKGTRARIQDCLDKGAEIMVQAYKEEIGNKGAAFTSDITIPGRYLVLMPFAGGGGVSRKISDEKTRKRLKDLIKKLDPPEGMGIIVRTAGVGRTKSELEHDYEQLIRTWGHIQAGFERRREPGIVHQEQDVVIRSVRDYFTDDIDEVVIDAESLHTKVVEFFERHMPDNLDKVRHYTGKMPIFSNFGLERQLENIVSQQVPLESGGSIVINPTEALTAIDVNSGKSKGQASQEQMAYETNLEAAAAVARQLRLRDLGGLVVVDFIDMMENKHRKAVEKALKQALKQDKARTEVGRISRFGLLEMSRQRLRGRLLSSTHKTCPMCNGSGFVLSTDTSALTMLRRLQELAVSAPRQATIRGRLPLDVALYLLNTCRQAIASLEEQFEVTIEIIPDATQLGATRESFEIVTPGGEEKRKSERPSRDRGRSRGRGDRRDDRRGRGRDRDDRRRKSERPAETEEVAAKGAEDEPYSPPKILGFISPDRLASQTDDEEESAEASEAPEAAAEAAEGEGEGRRRRRRRRRGGRRDEAAAEATVEATEAETSAEGDDAEIVAEASEDDENRGRRRRRRRRRGGRRDEATAEVTTEAAEAEEDAVEGDDAAPAADPRARLKAAMRNRKRGRGAVPEQVADAYTGETETADVVEEAEAAPEGGEATPADDAARRRAEARARNRERRAARRAQKEGRKTAAGQVAGDDAVAVPEQVADAYTGLAEAKADESEEATEGRRGRARIKERLRNRRGRRGSETLPTEVSEAYAGDKAEAKAEAPAEEAPRGRSRDRIKERLRHRRGAQSDYEAPVEEKEEAVIEAVAEAEVAASEPEADPISADVISAYTAKTEEVDEGLDLDAYVQDPPSEPIVISPERRAETLAKAMDRLRARVASQAEAAAKAAAKPVKAPKAPPRRVKARRAAQKAMEKLRVKLDVIEPPAEVEAPVVKAPPRRVKARATAKKAAAKMRARLGIEVAAPAKPTRARRPRKTAAQKAAEAAAETTTVEATAEAPAAPAAEAPAEKPKRPRRTRKTAAQRAAEAAEAAAEAPAEVAPEAPAKPARTRRTRKTAAAEAPAEATAEAPAKPARTRRTRKTAAQKAAEAAAEAPAEAAPEAPAKPARTRRPRKTAAQKAAEASAAAEAPAEEKPKRTRRTRKTPAKPAAKKDTAKDAAEAIFSTISD